MMTDSSPSMALNNFKKQLDTLSESLDNFDPVERSKALEILQECIQGLESKNSCLLTEDSYEEMKTEVTDKNPVKGSACSVDNSCHDPNNLGEKEYEGLEYNLQSDEECESQSEEDWKCPKCEEEFDDKPSFLEHLQLYSGKLKSCVDCHKVFQNSIAYRFHKQLDMCAKSSKVYKCKLCSKTLFGRSQYNTHLNAHKRNQCKTCGDHFARRKHLVAHSVNVHNASFSKDLFRCHLCDRTFTQRRSLVYHYKITHPDNNLVCSVCLEMFDSNSELEVHQATHKQQMFNCDKCNTYFSRRQQYLVHMKEHDKYKCQTCSETFAAKKAAVKHAREGHEVSGLKPQLQCAVCGQLFLLRALLTSHMTQHTGGKILSCEKCKVTFKHERNYRSHLETKEHLRGEEPRNLLFCTECNKPFTNKNNLRVHVNRMHKANLKEHACTYCLYKTTMLTNLKRHIALHTVKPQFICDKCGMQFQTKSSLQEHHLHLHADVKDFSCDKCGKMFGRASDLNRHLLNTHSDTPLYTCHCGNSYKSLSNLKRHQLLTHGNVDTKQERLKKLFQLEERGDLPPKKKVKKPKTKSEPTPTNVDDLQLLESQLPTLSSAMAETNTVVMMAETHHEELLQVPYNMAFTEDKSHVVYSQNLDMGGLHVVESMIQLDNDPTKEEASVMINVRNLFPCRSLANDYIMPSQMESSIVNSLGDALADATQHLAVTDQKQDVISGLQDYIINPHDLNFLSV